MHVRRIKVELKVEDTLAKDLIMFYEEDGMSDFEPMVRVALMNKDDVIALIGFVTDEEGGTLTRVDPRASPPIATSRCDTATKARQLFKRSLRTSIANGWDVFYQGVPLEG